VLERRHLTQEHGDAVWKGAPEEEISNVTVRGGEMKWLSEDLTSLRELYINQLRVLLSAEEQILRGLPVMIDHATSEELQEAFRTHLRESEGHVKRLETLLATAKEQDPAITSIDPLKCKAMAALTTEAEDMIQDARKTSVRDAALIAAAQRIEHYEIAAYGAVRHFARLLGDAHAAELLDQTIKEEGHADHRLTSIAERVNVEAKRTAA
jgi:ferritin-like metal-binding protein YciE